MTRTVALRASALFALLAAVFAAIAASAASPLAGSLLITSLALAGLTASFGFAVPARAPAPVRIRR